MLNVVARRRRLAVIRGGLLGFLLLAVTGIAALLSFGRAGRPEDPAQAGKEGAAGALPRDVVVAGEGSGFDITDGERTVFRIRAARTQADRAETVSLEDVEIDAPRGDQRYLIKAEHARVNRETRHVLLEGNVVVEGSNGAALETDWLELREGGNLLIASQGTTFRVAGVLSGRAQTLHVHLERQLVLAGGGVEMDSVSGADVPFRVRAETLRIDRGNRLLRAEGEVDARRGNDSLATRRLTVRLDEFSDRVRYLRALWGVNGTFETEAEDGAAAQRIAFTGETLSLYFKPEAEQIDSLELEGLPRRLAAIRASDPGGAERLLEGRLLIASFAEGALASADVMGPLRVRDRAPAGADGGAVEREASAQGGAQASFDSRGQLVAMTLDGDVVIREGTFVARGATATIDGAAGSAELVGAPANVTTERGRLTAAKITHQRRSGMLRAQDGVRAQLVRAAGGPGPLPWASEGDEPLRVEAGEALLAAQSDGDFVFKQSVRAWQGQNLLLADQLRGRQDGTTLAASGNVKTIWHPTAAEQESAAAEPAGPIEVVAEGMAYGQADQQIVYTGSVRTLQQQRTLECAEMAVDLGPEQQAERMSCQGGTRLVDSELQRTIDGTRAIYDLLAGEIEFFGTPIVLHDPQRGEVRAQGLRYHLETGALRMGGQPPPGERPAAGAAPAAPETVESGQ